MDERACIAWDFRFFFFFFLLMLILLLSQIFFFFLLERYIQRVKHGNTAVQGIETKFEP